MSTEPPPAGSAAPPAKVSRERTDRFRAGVGVLIALVSIFGAVVVWRASVESSNASDLTQQGTQQLILQQQTRGSIEAGVARDFRLFIDFQEHVMNWRQLLSQADRQASSDATLAADLRSQARSELSQARHIRPLMQNFDRPSFGDEQGVVAFDPGLLVKALADANLELTGLRPDLTFADADSAHHKSLHLVGLAVLFAAALLFLTFAQVARRGVRGTFAIAGIAVMVVATVLGAIVLVSG
jgi:hypothetical protein